MSAPDPMPCLASACPTPLSCSNAGTCSARRMDSARSYDIAIDECRKLGITPFRRKERG